MSIIQFLRILWARRWVIIGGTASCVIGAMIVGFMLPPRWEAHSRVLLDLIKPDPVTGMAFNAQSARPYVATQIELIKDYAVAGRVADDLGLLSDPALIASYQARGENDKRDFRRFVTQMIVDRTSAQLVEGSNILEITYNGSSPEQARAVADALRKAYIETSRSFRVEQAGKNAEWYEDQAAKARVALDEAERASTEYQKANGIVLESGGAELEAARLQALASAAGAAPAPMIAPTVSSPARADLAAIDSMIAEQSKVLGPNHPELVGLRAKRVQLSSQVLQDEQAARANARAAVSAAGAGVGAMQSAMAAQRSRVMANRDKVEKARQLQDEADLRRTLYTETLKKAADFRHEAAAPVTGITMLGSAVTPQSPRFPNWTMLQVGSLILGLGVGVGSGLLMELFGRRVRGPEDLNVIDAPMLAVVTTPASRRNGPFKLAAATAQGLITRKPPKSDRPKAVAA